MDKEDLKKSTCINLRCVTQSSKGGVPLSQLQNDYRKLLGTPIPFKELGYSSLESFLRAIPDVICLKKNPNGSLTVEGVADASTAHIAKLISKQKSSKKSKSASAKPARHVTRTWGSSGKTQSPKLKAPLRDSNSFPPSTTLHGRSEQNSKFLYLTPAQQELKKSVLINLRSVVQSCKDGVPLNRLNKDYRKFIGSNIPFENLGYHTLYEFVQSIPDVIRLKMDVNEQYIAIGVVDEATAHLFGNPVKPKPSKPVSPPNEPSKSSVNNKIIFQFSSQQKAESSFFKLPQSTTELSDLDSVLKYGPTKKKVRKKTRPVYSVSELIKKNKMKNALKEGLIKEELLKAAKLGTSWEEDSASEASLSKTCITSLQNQKKFDKKVQNQIKIANLSPLVWMDFLLNGPTKIETLREKVLSFCGFPFSSDSKEWKEKISLLSQLPKETLHQCLYLLGIEYELKDSKNSLQEKLISFLVNYTEKSGTNVLGTEVENWEKELYGSTQTLSSVSSDIYSKCSYFADTETSDAVLSDKDFAAPKTKHKIVSDSDSDFMDSNLSKKSSHHVKETKETVQVDKGNFHNENCEIIPSGNTCKTKISENGKSAKPIFTKQKTAVVLNQQLLDTNSIVQKADAEECSKTETSSLSSKSAKRKRRKERKKAENEQKNNALSATKQIQVSTPNEKAPVDEKTAEPKEEAEECPKTETSTPTSAKSARRKRMREGRRERKKAENAQKNIGLPVLKPV